MYTRRSDVRHGHDQRHSFVLVVAVALLAITANTNAESSTNNNKGAVLASKKTYKFSNPFPGEQENMQSSDNNFFTNQHKQGLDADMIFEAFSGVYVPGTGLSLTNEFIQSQCSSEWINLFECTVESCPTFNFQSCEGFVGQEDDDDFGSLTGTPALLLPNTMDYIEDACGEDRLGSDDQEACEEACAPASDCCNPYANGNSTCFEEQLSGCFSYAKCHSLDGYIDAAHNDLDRICAKASIEINREECERACSSVTCCYTQEESCVASQFAACMDYAPCQNLKEDSVDVAPTVAPSVDVAPTDLDERCDKGTPSCKRDCREALCCSDPNSACYRENFVACLSYASCTGNSDTRIAVAPIYSRIDPAPIILEDICSIKGLADFGTIKCLEACAAAQCCWVAGAGGCFGDDPLGCMEYQRCTILNMPEYAALTFPPTAHRPAIPAPGPAPAAGAGAGAEAPAPAPDQTNTVAATDKEGRQLTSNDSLTVQTTSAAVAAANQTTARDCDDICGFLQQDVGCCLEGCRAAKFDLLVCAIFETTGKDRSGCVCEPLSEDPAPAPDEISPPANSTDIIVSVNSSFVISVLEGLAEGLTAEQLREELMNGNSSSLRLLADAFDDFVRSVVDSVLASAGRRHLESQTEPPREFEKATTSKLEPGSAEIYDFVDTSCEATQNSVTSISRQSGNDIDIGRTCIVVFGVYQITVDSGEENPQDAYETFQEATQASIRAGKLQESLQMAAADNTNATNLFVVEGVSSIVDVNFVAFELPTEADADNKQNMTAAPTYSTTASSTSAPSPTSAPTTAANETDASKSSAPSRFPSLHSALFIASVALVLTG